MSNTGPESDLDTDSQAPGYEPVNFSEQGTIIDENSTCESVLLFPTRTETETGSLRDENESIISGMHKMSFTGGSNQVSTLTILDSKITVINEENPISPLSTPSNSNSEPSESTRTAITTPGNTEIVAITGTTDGTVTVDAAEVTGTRSITTQEINPAEAASSWSALFKALGDIQERYNLTPQQTYDMFIEITEGS
ncbi:hypothetical protein FBU30_006206 [Linnemannia zychae]|nr:hypothetical protein FBU30_006206 [Linnemannia zychae]